MYYSQDNVPLELIKRNTYRRLLLLQLREIRFSFDSLALQVTNLRRACFEGLLLVYDTVQKTIQI